MDTKTKVEYTKSKVEVRVHVVPDGEELDSFFAATVTKRKEVDWEDEGMAMKWGPVEIFPGSVTIPASIDEIDRYRTQLFECSKIGENLESMHPTGSKAIVT